MDDEPVTHQLPFMKDDIGESWKLVPSQEDRIPLMVQTYFSLFADSLAHNLIKESVKLRKGLHHARELFRQAKTKPDKIKKDVALEGRPTISYRGGVPQLEMHPHVVFARVRSSIVCCSPTH